MTPDPSQNAAPPGPERETSRAAPSPWSWAALGLRAIHLRYRMVLAVGALLAAVTALAAFVAPPKYEVRTKLLAQPSGALATRGDTSGRNSPTHLAGDIILRRENLVDLIRQTDLVKYWRANRDFLHRIKDRLSPPPSDEVMIQGLADTLRSRLQVQSDDTTVNIQVRWPDPVLAYRLADAATQSFLEARHVQEVSTLAESAGILEGHAAAARSRVDAAVRHVQSLLDQKSGGQKRSGGDEPASARTPKASAAAPGPDQAERTERAEKARARRAELGVVIQAKQRALDELESARRRHIADLQAKLEEQRTVYTDAHPIIAALRQTLEAAKSKHSPEAAHLQSEIGALQKEYDSLADAVGVTPSRTRPAGATPAARPPISAAMRLQEQLALENDPEVQYARLQLRHAIETYQSLEGQVGRTRIDLDTAQAAFGYRYTIVQPPELPRLPIWPRTPLVVGIALLAGLLIGVAGALGLELQVGVLRERWQVERALSLPVLAAIPESPPGHAVPPPIGQQRPKGARGVWLMMSSVGAVTVVAALVTNGNPVAALAPLAAFLVVWSITKLPLKVPALTVMFLILTLDNPAEQFAAGAYKSPLFPLAQLLQSQLKNTIPSGALVFTGIDVMLLLLFGVHVYRRATGSRIDREGAVAVPLPLVVAAWACLAGSVVAWVLGLATGGSFRFSLWQIQRNIYLPLMFLLFQAAFPSPSSYRSIGKLLVVAAVIKSVMALWIRHAFPKAEYATSHSDSMLFATVVCIFVIAFFERRSRRTFKQLLLFLPLLIAGMIANDRRLVWVNLAFALMFAFFMMPWSRLKIRVTRSILASIPVVIVYCVVGWHSTSKIFAPVEMIRSVVVSKSDMSTLWRDLENFNLVSTLKAHPILGTGWGHPYLEVMHMPDVTSVYELEPYLPHNSIVGLFAYTGYVGFALLWTIIVVGLYFAARAYYNSRDPDDRTAALTAFCAFVVYSNQAYGDMGLGSWTSVFLIASALTVGGKLCVKAGAWSHRARSRGREAATIEVGPHRRLAP